MPTCFATGCTNSTYKRPDGAILHKFPTEKELIKQWIINTGREVWDLEEVSKEVLEDKGGNKFRLCSQHFAPECYQRDLMAEMLGFPPKKKLKNDAVPTIFFHHPVKEEKESVVIDVVEKKKKTKKAPVDTAEASCSLQIPAKKSKKALPKNKKCGSELEKKKMPSSSSLKPILPAKKKCVAEASTQTDDIPEELMVDDASCQTDPVTDEPSWSNVSCQTERSEEATKILLELLGPDYFDWRPKPRKSEPAAAPQGSNSSDQPIIKQEGPVVKQEGPVVKQEGTIVKQEGDTDHDYVVAVKVTDQLLGEAAQASVKEEPPESGYSVELLKSSVISQPPVVQTTVCMKNSLISQPPLVQTTVCTKNSVISQSPVVQTSVCTFPVLQLSTGQFASTSGQLGGIGKSRKSVVTNSNRQLHLLGACEVDYLVPEDTDDPLLVPEKVYTEVKYDYNELAHLWEQLPLESKQALAMADHRYLLTEAKQGTNLGGNSGVKKKTKMNRKLIGKYNPKTLKEMINVEGLPLYEDAPSLGEASPAEVTIRVYVEDEAQGAKKKKGKGKKRKGKAANAKGKPTSNNKEVEKDKDKIPHVCSAEKPSQDDDYEPLQLEVTAEEEMNERFAKGPEYRTEENAEPSVIEASREKEEMDVPEQEKEEEEEEEWDLEPSEDEFDYIDKKDDDYNPWSENSDSNSESEPGNASSSELDFSPDSESVPDSDSDSFADSVIKPKIQKEPVKEHQEAIPVAQRRSLRLRKKSKPDADVDQEEEQMDVTSQDGTDPKEEPATFPQTFIFPKKGYKCKYCDLTFRKKLRMKHHLHLTHLKTKYKPFKCSYDDCKRRFLLKKMLKQHIKNFHETVRTPVKKEFVCGFTGCNKVFRSKPRLNVHMQIHSETRDWVCKECGKTFKLQKCLSMHMKIHTGEKRLQCAVCGELFRQKASLNWHMTKHEESSDSFFKVSCEVCGKKFEKEKGREAHMLKVHGRTAV